jgi:hypothetical protein
MEMKNQTRGKLVTAATIDVRVFFFISSVRSARK